ncbi:unnamed protein product [Protopolystoma xenopodis]|uniref:Uncharacterized protein n=1 Tax=Protopolystoma xenopodis TaxID=117903 RepID=A0A448X428_9PLAT|nr:unnamed protein product [Protopolystoma xenopodis]
MLTPFREVPYSSPPGFSARPPPLCRALFRALPFSLFLITRAIHVNLHGRIRSAGSRQLSRHELPLRRHVCNPLALAPDEFW